MLRTHYDNLSVNQLASPREIRRAYRKLCQQHHPDKCPGDDDANRRIRIINQSYAVLSNKQLRKRHDRWIEKKLKQLSRKKHKMTCKTLMLPLPVNPAETPLHYLKPTPINRKFAEVYTEILNQKKTSKVDQPPHGEGDNQVVKNKKTAKSNNHYLWIGMLVGLMLITRESDELSDVLNEEYLQFVESRVGEQPFRASSNDGKLQDYTTVESSEDWVRANIY